MTQNGVGGWTSRRLPSAREEAPDGRRLRLLVSGSGGKRGLWTAACKRPRVVATPLKCNAQTYMWVVDSHGKCTMT